MLHQKVNQAVEIWVDPCHSHQSEHSQRNLGHFLNTQTFTKIFQKNPAVLMQQYYCSTGNATTSLGKSGANANKSRYSLLEAGTYFFIIKFFLFVPAIPIKSNIVVCVYVLAFWSPLDFCQLSFDSLCIVLGTFEVILISNYFSKVVECCCDQVEFWEVMGMELLDVIFGNGPPIINTFLVFENF